MGIVGVNGSGKSTLLRAIAGDVPLAGGKRKVGATVQLAYLTQEVRELERYAEWRVIEAIEDVRKFIRLGRKEISAVAARPAARLHRRPPADAGQRPVRRGAPALQLTRLLMAEPNVLLLDEPTNDLDIETLTSLEDVLDGWAGTLLVVSHDRYLLERICDRQVALMGDGRLRELPGGVEQYLELRHAQSAAVGAEVAREAASTATVAAAGPSAAELRDARKEMARVEKQLARLSEREERLHAAMVEAATDHARVLELNTQLREVVDEREGLELAWLAAAEVVG